MSDIAKQRQLPFPQSKEGDRLATIKRLFGDHPKAKTAAKLFSEANQREAEQLTKEVSGRP